MTAENVLICVASVLMELIIAILLRIVLKHLRKMSKSLYALRRLVNPPINAHLHTQGNEKSADMIVIQTITMIETLFTQIKRLDITLLTSMSVKILYFTLKTLLTPPNPHLSHSSPIVTYKTDYRKILVPFPS